MTSISLARMALPSSRILHASLREENSSRRRISSSENVRRWIDDGRAIALLVAVPAFASLLPKAPQLDKAVGDRQTAIGRIGGRAALSRVVADVEPRHVVDRERPDRVAEIHHHLVDLLGQGALLDHEPCSRLKGMR